MKKIYAFMIVMAMSFSLVACGKGASDAELAEDTSLEYLDVENIAEGSGEGEVVEETVEEVEKAADAEKSAEAEASKESSAADASKDASKDAKSADASKDSSATDASKDASKDSSSAEAAKDASAADAAKSAEEAAKAAEEAAKAAEAEKAAAEAAAAAAQQPSKGYGRKIFIGDSRTVDMFSASAEEIRGEVHNDMPVYCKNGCQFQYMVDAINEVGMDNFDTLVTWMGCNDFGNFSQYGPYYDQLLANGKQIVVLTIGPTQDEFLLDDMDWYYYPNSNQINFNNALVPWAKSHGVKIIDMYTYINNSSTVNLDPKDGIHYLPQPTTELWNYIVSKLN